MQIDQNVLLLLFPVVSTAVLGWLQYRTNAKLANVTQNRADAQNEADDSAALKNYAEANAITSKSLADEQQRRHDLEKRVAELEKNASSQKVRLILDLDLSSEIKIISASVERMKRGGTGPLIDPATRARQS